MKYLKKFETEAQYTAAESGLILPNVSLVTENNTLHYNPYFDPYVGHEYVEIGGLKWATMNIGAESVTDYGLYFQWGDVQGYTAEQVGSGEGQKYFGWEDYKYGNGESFPGQGATGVTKYNTTDGLTILEESDDAAVVNWGGSWRMPTSGDFSTLSAATTNSWIHDYEGSGIDGRLFTGKAGTVDEGKTLFFPVAGYCYQGNMFKVGYSGHYWTSSVCNNGNGRLLLIGNMETPYISLQYKAHGYSVRPVVG